MVLTAANKERKQI